MNDANMGHAYDGLLWTLRYNSEFTVQISAVFINFAM